MLLFQSKKHMKLTIILFILTLAVMPFILKIVVNSGIKKCLFNNIFGVECYGCGMTRAFYNFSKFNFREAIRQNFLIIIAAPLSICIYFDFLRKGVLKQIRKNGGESNGRKSK